MSDRTDPKVVAFPEHLRQPPVPFSNPPPVDKRLDELPFGQVDENQFEYLVLDYLQAVRGWKDPQRYGEAGQSQQGIDLVDMDASSGYPTCQVKRRKEFGPKALENAVKAWLAARPLGSTTFLVAVSKKLSSESQRKLAELSEQHPSVKLEAIDAGVLNRDLRNYAEIVLRHFHPAWAEAFCDPSALSRAGLRNARQKFALDSLAVSNHRERTRLFALGVPEESLDAVVSLADSHYRSTVQHVAQPQLIAIEGPGGSGKSSLLDRVYRLRLENALRDASQPLPVFFTAQEAPSDLIAALHVADESVKSFHIDGLDEVSMSRAQEITSQLRSLISVGRIAQATITRRLRANETSDLPTYSLADLSETQAEELMSAVASRDVGLHGIPDGSARKAVRLPLFAIVAGRLRSQGRTVPSSRAQFLVALAESEKSRVVNNELLWEELAELATMTVSKGGSVSRSEVGPDPKLARLLESRFVEQVGGALRFALPILEQFFAAQALIKDANLLEAALGDLVAFETWREPLSIAFALMPWNEADHLADLTADLVPGAVWKLITDSFSGPASLGSAVPMPSDEECEDRIEVALSRVLDAIGPVRALLGLTAPDGQPLPVGVQIDNGRMAVAIWAPGSDRPATKETIYDGWRGPSDWSFEKFEPAYFAEEVWPLGSAMEFVDRAITPHLESVGFAVGHRDTAWPERRYEIARTLGDERSLITKPVRIEKIEEALAALRERSADLDGLINYSFFPGQNRPRIRLMVWAQELKQFLEDLNDPGCTTEVAAPWTPPDQLHGSGWAWGLWSEDAWLQLIEEVYQCALVSYGEIIDRWFTPLKPYLGIGGMWPVELRVQVGFAGESSGMPGCPWMSGRFVPLVPGSEPLVSFTDESISFSSDWEPPTHEGAILDDHHPGALQWVRWPGRFQTVDVGCTGSAPALELAYNWLIGDLSQLGVVSNSLIRQRRH